MQPDKVDRVEVLNQTGKTLRQENYSSDLRSVSFKKDNRDIVQTRIANPLVEGSQKIINVKLPSTNCRTIKMALSLKNAFSTITVHPKAIRRVSMDSVTSSMYKS